MPCPANFKEVFQCLFRLEFRLAIREMRLLYQKYTRGWDDSDVWNLDATICEFVLPRLKRYREIHCAYPSSYGDDGEKAFADDLDLIIWSIEKHLEDDWLMGLSEEDRIKVQAGFEKFGFLLRSLWD